MITKYQANRMLNLHFGMTSYTFPSNLYIGLSTTNINQDGSNVTEPKDGAYHRMKIPNDKLHFSVSTDAELHVLIEITFPEAEQDWGVVKDIFIADAYTDGNILYFDTLEQQREIKVNYEIVFPIGTIKIKMVSEE